MNAPNCAQVLAAAQTLGLDRLDAQLLLLHALGKPGDARAWLLAHDTDVLPQQAAENFRAVCLRRVAGEPLAYIVGEKEFFGLALRVDARVLVPRPDTETLVEWALECLRAPGVPAAPSVLDLGTGSGAIALAIAHSLQADGRQGKVTAVDASADALEVARGNAARLGLKLDFIESHWLEKVGGHFHLIVSNPPYIASADPHLEALAYEPLAALAAGEDGLDDIRAIARQAPDSLLPGGWLLLEHGYDQAEAVCALLAREGFVQVQNRLDLAGIARCSGGLWPGG
ncbi:peptide chain release factor N(5)-glutamine methyltransferase [Polaromonas sp. JS666]|uniref:peptide chain release factor N(5)-glutamine methyltransferase n=1 Tax=Polaromonas sp. (strain JS666 / ATCC BAA-500) TaxID=296591 RepID=UPI0008863583|nr:peptide chain release factor N(5)-glutamine methyltransferase [Polaromonas sp. JS666]SDN48069.1 [protein release factor]-glutamine N5-methyltransferase [Polaromonas sp. JS666]